MPCVILLSVIIYSRCCGAPDKDVSAYILGPVQALYSIIWNATCHYAECHYHLCCGAPEKMSAHIFFRVCPSFVQHHLKWHVSLCWVSLSILDVVVPRKRCLHIYFLGSAQALFSIIWNAMCRYAECHYSRCSGAPDKTSVRIFIRVNPSLVEHHLKCHVSLCWVSLS